MSRTKAIVLCAVSVFLAGSPLWAESPFSAKISLRDNLSALQAAKKAVVVVLRSGQTYTARVGEIGDHYVVLSAPQGKEFYDVLVPIEAIAALEARARDQ